MHRPTIVLHIGPHKTGTTSFQTYCALSAASLLPEIGVLYPLSLSDPFVHHNPLSWLLAWMAGGRRDPLVALTRFADQATPAEALSLARAMLQQRYRATPLPRILLSAEEFSTLPEASVNALAGITDWADRRVILAYRPRVGLVLSQFAQDIRHGFGGSLKTFVHNRLMGDPVFYRDVVRSWGSIATMTSVVPGWTEGVERHRRIEEMLTATSDREVTLIPEAAKRSNAPGQGRAAWDPWLVQRQLLSIDWNASLSAWHVMLIRRLNAIARSYAPEAGEFFSSAVYDRLGRLVNRAEIPAPFIGASLLQLLPQGEWSEAKSRLRACQVEDERQLRHVTLGMSDVDAAWAMQDHLSGAESTRAARAFTDQDVSDSIGEAEAVLAVHIPELVAAAQAT